MRGLKALTVLALALAAPAQEYVISTFAGGAPPATPVLGVNMPLGALQTVAADAMGNTYFVASHCVFKLDQNDVVTRIAGNGRGGYSGDGGPAIDAQLSFPTDVAVDGAGNVYIADCSNNRIRKVSQDGIITTIAGNGIQGYSGDGGPATRASFFEPSALAVDSAGNIYVADTGNNAIRVLRPVTTQVIRAEGR